MVQLSKLFHLQYIALD